MSIDWSKANDRAVAALVAKKDNVHYPSIEFVAGYHRTGCMIRATSADDGRPLSAQEDFWVIVERPATWSGKGLPPVGTVCEFAGGTYSPEDPFDNDLREGDRVTIIAHFKDGDLDLAAFTFNPQVRNPDRGAACVEQGAYGCFRPIRTPEQIAAEERSKECDRIFAILSSVEREGNRSDMAEALYDAGYRRQESST
ncbi:hypothetical protein [Pseudomonas aeruginosa]|uniref:hypothetical protein n=1 Tax=Pseudomonas aeruginosa TaxID=287 RepID=UPI003F81472D